MAVSQYICTPKLTLADRQTDKLAFYYFLLITQGLIEPCTIQANYIYWLTTVKGMN